MILDGLTYEVYKYYPKDLKPYSDKPILVACDNCGKIRIIVKYQYRNLCISCALKGKKQAFGSKRTEEEKAIHSAAMKGKKNPFFTKRHTDEAKALMSAAHSGEKSHNWLGGISFGQYCTKFNNHYKQHIRILFGNECFLCSMTTEENGRALDVHHVNYNKDCGCDGIKCICVPLCASCHAKTGHDRIYWQTLIMEILKPSEAWM